MALRIAFFGKGVRGASCLKALLQKGFDVVVVITHPPKGKPETDLVAIHAMQAGISCLAPDDPNEDSFLSVLREYKPDVAVLGGYGKIVKQTFLTIPRLMTINLHGGKLPQMRGSSPMNWALINGDTSFSISIIKVDGGIDTGDVLSERSFSIGPDDTINDLHEKANRHFPLMLLDSLNKIVNCSIHPVAQNSEKASYYPLRFPRDGLILWDMVTAQEAHNRIRALTEPYPCAYSYYNGKKILLVSSSMRSCDYYGEPGRIYQIKDNRVLVCAKDKCLWLESARCAEEGRPLHELVSRYDQLATVSFAAEAVMSMWSEEQR